MQIEFYDFQKWLNGFHDSDSVGEARVCETCPMAKFVVQKGFRRAEVYENSIWIVDQDGKCQQYDMDAWAQTFVELVDVRYQKGEAVSAYKAREILIRAKETTEEPREYL